MSAWSGVELDEPVLGGHRNEVWSGWLHHQRVSVRRSRRSPESLEWELGLLVELERAGFLVPMVVRTDSGRLSAGGVIVQRWIDGREPTSVEDWLLVATELRRLHVEFSELPQRPGCVVVHELGPDSRSVDADIRALPDGVADELLGVFAGSAGCLVSVIHGDPGPSNLRITDTNQVGFLDWDESRVDVTHLDLANLGVQVLDDTQHSAATLLADAWEAANAWTAEPAYALDRLRSLRARRGG